MIEEISTPEGLDIVLRSNPCVVVMFKIETCPFCQRANPHMLELAKKGNLIVVKIDVSITPVIGFMYGIQKVPTFIVFHNGEEKHRISGHNQQAIETAIQKYLN